MLKIIKEDVLDEEFLTEVYFTDERNLDYHYNKHVISDEDGDWKMDYVTKDKYNEMADWLSSVKIVGDATDQAYKGRFVGYVSHDGRIIIRDNVSNLVVVFVDDDIHGHSSIALYKQHRNKFNRKMNDPNGAFRFVKSIKDI